MTEERIGGSATPEGTRRRLEEGPMEDPFYREHDGLALSTIGLGTYLGETDEKARRAYRDAAASALEGGVTVLDTAINYRHQASERDLRHALDGFGAREAAFVVTKGGFLHGDVDDERSSWEHIRETYIDGGIVEPEDISASSHAMTPAFLRHELEQSLGNLGLETVDLYLVHNPEVQLDAGVPREQVYADVLEAFEELERQRARGRLVGYGVSTWDALRLPPDEEGHLGIERLIELAAQAHASVGEGDEHGFRGVQLPFNLAMPEALTRPTQPFQGDLRPALAAAREAGLVVLTSASLLQGRLLGGVDPEVKEILDVETDVAAALQFARSAPGTTTALVGMGQVAHVEENLATVRGLEPDPDAVRALVESGPLEE